MAGHASDRTVSSHAGLGIIDTGASKTVIGQKRVSALLGSLPSALSSKVERRRSDTVFSFGNNGTLRTLGALFVPFGRRWMRVEIVEGSTLFLISNAFLRAVEAELNVAKAIMHVPG